MHSKKLFELEFSMAQKKVAKITQRSISLLNPSIIRRESIFTQKSIKKFGSLVQPSIT